MTNKLITALKENKNDIRKKVIITTGVVAATVAAGIVLSKMANKPDVVLVVEDAVDAVADATGE